MNYEQSETFQNKPGAGFSKTCFVVITLIVDQPDIMLWNLLHVLKRLFRFSLCHQRNPPIRNKYFHFTEESFNFSTSSKSIKKKWKRSWRKRERRLAGRRCCARSTKESFWTSWSKKMRRPQARWVFVLLYSPRWRFIVDTPLFLMFALLVTYTITNCILVSFIY